MSSISQYFLSPKMYCRMPLRFKTRRHVDSTLTNETNFLLPFYINGQGGNSSQATQCAGGGTNSLEANLAALNEGQNNMWPSK